MSRSLFLRSPGLGSILKSLQLIEEETFLLFLSQGFALKLEIQ
jgi:hypothetical protein